MKSGLAVVACAAAVLLGRLAGADFVYELDHPVVIVATSSAITAPLSTPVVPEAVEPMSWRLAEPTSCISPCLSPIYDLLTPAVDLSDQTDGLRLNMSGPAVEDPLLSSRR